MSKLFKLKEWLLVSDAAKHLAIAFGETVTEADVLQLALDGHLKLSVHFVNGAYARPCIPVNIEEVEWNEVQSLDGKRIIKIPKGGRIWQDEQGCFQVKRNVSELGSGVWDLPMTGGERIDVEYRFQQLTDGPEVTAVTLEGVMVASANGDLHEIQSHFADNAHFNKDNLKKPLLHRDNFHPAGALPEDSVFVVRADALRDFEQSVNGAPASAERPLASRERDSLLTIIAVLCKEAKLDYAKPAKTAGLIQSTADSMGLAIGETTIENHLKRIPEALAGKKR